MHRALILTAALLSGCNTINVTVSGDNNRLTIEQPKTVTASPSAALSTGDNTIPVNGAP